MPADMSTPTTPTGQTSPATPKTAHTAGPWRRCNQERGEDSNWSFEVFAGDKLIATIETEDGETAEQDMILIASAPAMREEIEKLKAQVNSLESALACKCMSCAKHGTLYEVDGLYTLGDEWVCPACKDEELIAVLSDALNNLARHASGVAHTGDPAVYNPLEFAIAQARAALASSKGA